MIPLFKPCLTDETITEVMKTLSSGWWGLGKKVEIFEKDFARYIGVRHAIAVNSATSALHMAVRLLDIGLGDEVITTPISFVSTADAILYEHGTPIFADVCGKSCFTTTENMVRYEYEIEKKMFEMSPSRKSRTEILQEMSCRIYEGLEKVAPVDRSPETQRQMSKLCGGIFEAREIDKEALRAMLAQAFSNASRRLYEAPESDVALQNVPRGTSQEYTLNIDLFDIIRNITPNTKAIIPVHLYGTPVDMGIFALAQRFGLKVIEDCAHACGASYGEAGVKCGAVGDISCFSFHAVKNLPCGDGGMLCMDDDEIAEKARKMRWLGINKDTFTRCENVSGGEVKYGWDYDVESLGFKYHMNDISASIGIAQLKALEWGNDRRREIAQRYIKGLANYVRVPSYNEFSSYHIFAIRSQHRDALNIYLKDKGISTGVHYKPLHLHTYFKTFTTKPVLPVAEYEWTQLLSLPIFPELKEIEQDYIIQSIIEGLAECKK